MAIQKKQIGNVQTVVIKIELPTIHNMEINRRDWFDNIDWNNCPTKTTPERFDITKYAPYIDGIIRTEKNWKARIKYLNKQIRINNKIIKRCNNET